jgi:hypothetical protein
MASSAPRILVRHLLDAKLASFVGGSKVTSDTGLIGELRRGDVIVYVNDRGAYQHSALHLGGGKVACHTVCRTDFDWQGFAFPSWTLLRIK